jgi:hypothetical protein
VRTLSIIIAAGLTALSSASAISYVSISDDAGFTAELPEGFENVSEDVDNSPEIEELTGGKPYVVSLYIWEATELEGMGFSVVKIGDGGVPAEEMKTYVDDQLNAEMIPYKVNDLELTDARIAEIGADSGTGVQYRAEIEEMVMKVNIYYLQKGNASYLVILGWPMDAGLAGAGEHIEETFRLE